MPSPADVEALIDAHIKELADLNGWDASAGKDASGAPLPPREILIIDTVSFFFADRPGGNGCLVGVSQVFGGAVAQFPGHAGLCAVCRSRSDQDATL